MPATGDPAGGSELFAAILGTEQGWQVPTRLGELDNRFHRPQDDGPPQKPGG